MTPEELKAFFMLIGQSFASAFSEALWSHVGCVMKYLLWSHEVLDGIGLPPRPRKEESPW
jgi:hypothetical protein